MIKNLIKKIIPEFLINQYHKVLALLAAFLYGYPSEKLIVIGVTGTNGKSTTVNLIAKILEQAGFKVGLTSTMNFKIAKREWLNDKKMTMLGRFQTQKLLRQMAKAGCKYAIIETSSQGILQYRHLGINYDIAVFTNLTPEHIEAHGGFDNYKKAKGELFKKLSKDKHKIIDNKAVKKTSIINIDDKYADYFASFGTDQKFGFTTQNKNKIGFDKIINASKIRIKGFKTSFEINGTKFNLNLPGKFNVYNSLASICVALSQKIGLKTIKQGLEKIKGLPGRMEQIDKGQNFTIIVDYAPEPASIKQLYAFVKKLDKNKIIHVLGSAGGGRDISRRPILGAIASQNADYVIITNEDPYDDDPIKIINDVAEGAEKKGKILNQNLFKILDRKKAIQKALNLASENDLVLITGKGCEQAIATKGGKKIPWDDRKIVKELLDNKI